MKQPVNPQLKIFSYTIYHSANAYLGTQLLRHALKEYPEITLVRCPIFIPKNRGMLVADLLGGQENRNASSYNREDCARWAGKYNIPFEYPPSSRFEKLKLEWKHSALGREELPARAYYAADQEKRATFDTALFEAVWVKGLDANNPETIKWAAQQAQLDADDLLQRANSQHAFDQALANLEAFDEIKCPGVPTVVINQQRFFGKDRIDWIINAYRSLLEQNLSKPNA